MEGDEAKKRRHNITFPLDWMAAFSSYMAVAVHLKLQRAFELAGYTSIVSNLAREGRGQVWMRYDQLFRQAVATNPELQWHKREPNVWQMVVMDAVGSPSTRPAAQQGQPPEDQDKSRTGAHARCQFRHVCFVCRETGHITKDCPMLVSRSANHPATK